ncbi:MAG: DUF3971 domain-containing protein, partial [Cyclobacteriaceae bacterium]|nr:DUF3971 domain-containing protein [Cyclobacteriaceae bacterium]
DMYNNPVKGRLKTYFCNRLPSVLKALRKIIFYTVTGLVVLLIGLLASVFLFKDRIIQQFIREANKNLGTPVKIGTIEVSAFQDFPNLAIVLYDVYIEDSHPGEYPLLTAKKVSFVLNPVEVWQGRYTIRGLQVRDSETNLRINKAGKNNYTIVKSSGEGGAVSFDLKNVKLQNSFVSYIDVSASQHHEFSSGHLLTTIRAVGDVYHIEATGDVVSEQIGIGRSVFFRKKIFDVKANVDYDDRAKSLAIQPSQLTLDKALFEVSGTYHFKDKNLLDLQTIGKDTDIQTLLSLMPETTTQNFLKYQSKGDVYFDMTLKGEISKTKDPFLSMAFGLKNVTLYHPEFQSRIENANLEGSFATPSLSRLTDAELFLKNVSATLNGDHFTGNFALRNFDDPFVNTDFKGEVNAAALLNFFPMEDFHQLSGRMKANVSLNGPVALLKKKSTAQQVRTEGTVELMDINMVVGKEKLAFKQLNGSLRFDNNDLAMSNLRGRFEKSDFLLNGFFKNIVTFLIFENQLIGIEADLTSDFLDVDHLFAVGFGTDEKGPYRFSISPNVALNFNYNVKALRYKKFHPTSIKGDLLVKNQVAVSRNIQLNAMGGSLSLSGILDAKNPKAIDLISSAKFNGIYIDSLFYVFGNFQQDFIGYHHLKGQSYADISMEGTLDETLLLKSQSLVADVSATIKNGELNNFQPMQKLSKYLDDEGLSQLRFADLKNDIHIENKTVYIPQMEIRSNVTVIQLSGTHTFDQKIDYRVVAPLRSKKKIDPDEAFGSIEQDSKGQSKIFLKITGTTDQYDVAYDKEAVKMKISSDLKKEVQELKDAFKLKGKKKKKELELEKDEYFDWDDPHNPGDRS